MKTISLQMSFKIHFRCGNPPLCSGVIEVPSGPKSHTFTVILALFAPQPGAINRERVYCVYILKMFSWNSSVINKGLQVAFCSISSQWKKRSFIFFYQYVSNVPRGIMRPTDKATADSRSVQSFAIVKNTGHGNFVIGRFSHTRARDGSSVWD